MQKRLREEIKELEDTIQLHGGCVLEFFGNFVDLSKVVAVHQLRQRSPRDIRMIFHLDCQYMLQPVEVSFEGKFGKIIYKHKSIRNEDVPELVKHLYCHFISIWIGYCNERN